MEQQQRSRDVCAVGVADGDGGGISELIFLTGRGYKICQLPSTKSKVFEIEDPFGQPAKEPGHPILQHLASRTEKRRSGSERLAQRKKIIFIPTSTVEQEQRSGLN
jgi:hypothetical protein